MTEYSRSAKGTYTLGTTGNAVTVFLPFQPSLIKLRNQTAYQNFVASDIPFATWNSNMAQGTALCEYVGSGPVLQTAYISTGGFSTFSGGILNQFGPTLTVTAVTKSSTAPQVTTSAAHGLAVGNVVIFENLYQTTSTGMPQICGMPFVVASIVNSTNFTISYNNNVSGYTALSGGPTGPTPTCKQVLYPNLYAPNVGFIAAITTGTTTTVTTTAPTNFQVGQAVAFRIPSAWGTTQLNSLPNTLIPGQAIYGYVQSVTNSTTFVVNINSTGYTAFTTNVSFATSQAGGLSFPQVIAIGDVNSGGQAYSGGALYPSPQFYNGLGNALTSSINGPGILGAFDNNTGQGFVIGSGNASYQGGSADASSHLSGLTSDVVYWEAHYYDIGN